jgi:hypothetical protein
VCMKIFSLPCESIRGLHTFYGFLTEWLALQLTMTLSPPHKAHKIMS